VELWKKLNAEVVPALNRQLELSKLKPLPAAADRVAALACTN
jgi:hypothetical protein